MKDKVLIYLLIALAAGFFLYVYFSDYVSPTPLDQAILCGTLTPAQSASNADLVVTGEVFAVVPGDTYAEVLFNADRVYKGTLPGRGIRILSIPVEENVQYPAGDIPPDLHFTSDDPPYLLYLRSRDDGTYTTSKCFGSRLLDGGLTQGERSLLGEGQQVVD